MQSSNVAFLSALFEKSTSSHIQVWERERVLLPPFQHRDVPSDKDIQYQIYFSHIAEHF